MPQPEQWQLHGNAAELYERYAVPYFLGPWAPGLVELAALQRGSTCWTSPAAPGWSRALRPHTWGQRARSRAWISTQGCWPLPAHCHPRLARPSHGSRGVQWPWTSQTRRLTS